MSRSIPTFDESWHRVEGRLVRLRPGVDISAQRFRGQRWYVVRDALGNRFFRIRPPAYRFICELERSASVGEAWLKSLDADPEEAPGQSEVVQLLSQLHQSGLLRSDLEGDVAALFEAQQKEWKKSVSNQWANIFFLRIPLFNPDAFLKATLPWVGCFISRWAFLIWLAALGWGIKEITENWQQFKAEGGALLGFANLPWLYAAMIVIKAVHEFGHGYFCRKYGGEVPQMGVMLLLFNPLPYVDASSSWAFRDKRKRMLVGAAGMIVELFLASIAAVVWANTGDGATHTIAYNAVVIASVGTLLFNLNPLLRYDGYHILSDLIEVPNLQSHANRTVTYLMERYLFNLPGVENPAATKRETWGLAIYFFAAFIYRTLLLIGILLFVSQQYLIFGIILALVFAVLWLVIPVVKAFQYLFFQPRLEARRARAVGLSLGSLLAVLAFIVFMPVPSFFRADGVVRANPYAHVYTGTSGELVEVLIPSGSMVVEGTPLVRLQSFELEQETKLVSLDWSIAEAHSRAALDLDPVRFLTMQGYFKALRARLDRLAEEKKDLIVRASCPGRWVAPDLNTLVGTTVARGVELGVIQGEINHYFSAVVRQGDVARLFSGNVKETEVKILGQEQKTLAVTELQAIPAERGQLPSASLGVMGGGTSMVDSKDENIDRRTGSGLGLSDSSGGRGTRTTEPFFEVRATLEPSKNALLVHGQRGVARLNLPWEPLLTQWTRSIRQLFQRNYRI